jgi:chemotaxis protein CheX
VNGPEAAVEGDHPIGQAVRAQLLEPLIAATCSVLNEMAGTESAVQSVQRKSPHQLLGDIAAVFRLRAQAEARLVLSFPKDTAEGLAARIFRAANTQTDESLVWDCMGEIANVIAGQAKALLARTPYHLAFVLPQDVVAVKEFRPPQGLDCLVISFNCEQGAFALQLYMRLE